MVSNTYEPVANDALSGMGHRTTAQVIGIMAEHVDFISSFIALRNQEESEG